MRELLDSINLPQASTIYALKTTESANFHSVYLLSYPSRTVLPSITSTATNIETSDVILRVSGPPLPGFKTRNECAVMTWSKRYTNIPVPDSIHYDASS